MSERFTPTPPEPGGNGPFPPTRVQDDEGGLRAPPGLGPWGKFWWWLKFIFWVKTARLRFIAIVAAIGAVIVYWDTLNNYYEKWTRGADDHEHAASDTEYFCPMHPQIVRDSNKEKCPICFMPLSKRRKGENQEEPLPPGTVSRVQLSPYRVVLAGIQTWDVSYLPLRKEIVTAGFVEFDETRQKHVAARQKGRIEKLYANYTGQMVQEGDRLALLDVRYSPELMVTVQDLLNARRSRNRQRESSVRQRLARMDVSDEQIEEILRSGKIQTRMTVRSPIKGHVIEKYQVEGKYVDVGTPLYDIADLSTVWIEAQVYEDDLAFLRKGEKASATTDAFPNRTFPGEITFIHPHLDQNTRTLRVRLVMQNKGHVLRPGMYTTVTIKVPTARLDLVASTLADEQQSERRAELGQGRVLAVPESSVIDTGRLKLVYRQATPGVYEGVKVRLGPRMVGPRGDTYYPVIAGLTGGEKVVTAGAFLVDAQTRLNPAAGSIYYGGSGGKGSASGVAVRPTTPEEEDAKLQKARAGLAKLGPEDRRLAEAQKYCPVQQGNLLGEMGKPYKITLRGRPVFLCCSSCEDRARDNAKETLATVERLKSRGKAPAPKPVAPAQARLSAQEAKIKTALDKLSPEDRRLAEAQKYCPIQQQNRLGSMGKPFKVLLKGKRVFLCCDGCVDDARADPDQTLATVEKLKAKAKAETPKR
jgi:Cu(I)/Ag(I) efflux system membrane fusion protein